jgi:hypothetical protein
VRGGFGVAVAFFIGWSNALDRISKAGRNYE